MVKIQNNLMENAIKKYKYNHNINYSVPGDPHFKRLRLFLLLSTIYFLIFNFFYIAGVIVTLSNADKDTYSATVTGYMKTFIPIAISTFAVILGLVLSYFQKSTIFHFPFQTVGTILSACGAIANLITYFYAVLTVQYMDRLEDPQRLFGIQTFFYWRNLFPCLLVIIFATWMSWIYFSAKHHDRVIFDLVITNLYNRYRSGDKRGYTDDEWNSFLEIYNREGYQKQFDE